MLYQLSYTPGGTAKDKDEEAPRHGAMRLQGERHCSEPDYFATGTRSV